MEFILPGSPALLLELAFVPVIIPTEPDLGVGLDNDLFRWSLFRDLLSQGKIQDVPNGEVLYYYQLSYGCWDAAMHVCERIMKHFLCPVSVAAWKIPDIVCVQSGKIECNAGELLVTGKKIECSSDNADGFSPRCLGFY